MSTEVERRPKVGVHVWTAVAVVTLCVPLYLAAVFLIWLVSPARYHVFVTLPDGCLLVGAPVSESSTSAFITLPAGEQEVEVDCQGREYKVKLFIRQVSVNGATWELGEPRMHTYINSD
jgi:hypothetical protein